MDAIEPNEKDFETVSFAKSKWLNKIQLSHLILNKEGQLCGYERSMMEKIHKGFLNNEDEIMQSSEVNAAWGCIYELYVFLKHNDITTLAKKDPEVSLQLEKSMNNYSHFQKVLTYSEFLDCADAMHYIISMSGYHNTSVDDDDDFSREDS